MMKEIRGEFTDQQVRIFLSGRIDSNNAAAVEKEIRDLTEGKKEFILK